MGAKGFQGLILWLWDGSGGLLGGDSVKKRSPPPVRGRERGDRRKGETRKINWHYTDYRMGG